MNMHKRVGMSCLNHVELRIYEPQTTKLEPGNYFYCCTSKLAITIFGFLAVLGLFDLTKG